jgi:D-threo-aldose 1-dehydrogenase
VEHDDGVAVVSAAVEAGYGYIDTAPLYGYGAAEQIVGEALGGSTSVLLSTKVGRTLLPGIGRESDDVYKGSANCDARFDFSRDAIRRSIFSSLARLNQQRLHLVLIHDPEHHVDQAISETYPALEELRSEGVVAFIGVGTNYSGTPARFVQETGIDAVLIAGRYTLLDRSAEADLLPAARNKGVTIIAAGVYNSGVLSPTDLPTTYDYRQASASIVKRAGRLRRICASHGIPLAAAAVQFPLRHPAVSTVLVGARTAEEAIQNLEFSRLSIPSDLWEEVGDARHG